jgi:hypothetical protein
MKPTRQGVREVEQGPYVTMPAYPEGTRVVVVADETDPASGLGAGTIVGFEEVDVFGLIGWTPAILLDSGEGVYGFECWWHAQPEAK